MKLKSNNPLTLVDSDMLVNLIIQYHHKFDTKQDHYTTNQNILANLSKNFIKITTLSRKLDNEVIE